MASLVPEPMEKCAVWAASPSEDEVAVVPALVADGGEVEPLRVVGRAPVAGQFLGEDLADRAPRPARRRRRAGTRSSSVSSKPAAPPDVLVHLDDEGGARRPSTGNRGSAWSPTPSALTKNWKASKTWSVPSHMYLLCRRSSEGRKTSATRPPDLRVEAVGRRPPGRTLAAGPRRRGQRRVAHVDAEFAATPLQQLEQFLAAHGGEALAADGVRCGRGSGCRCRTSGRSGGHGVGERRCRRSRCRRASRRRTRRRSRRCRRGRCAPRR